MLDFNNVSFKYKNSNDYLIKDLSFTINKGDFVSLIGASGCGKSTILRLITSLEKANSGEILINDKNINSLKASTIGYMPQKDLLLPFRTILENTALPLEIQGKSKKDAKIEAEKMLEQFNLAEYKDKYPRDLSGGMKQRISFIRTLLTGADLLLLDEPFSALDALTKISLQQWTLKQWLNFDKTILFITHDVEEAIFLSNRILVIQEKPILTLKEIKIPLPQNRTREMLGSKEIISLKESLINDLGQRVII